MEQCPNCGEPIRPGAKFCTSCRYELTTELGASAPDEPSGPSDVEGNAGAGSDVTEIAAGWPSAPSREGPSAWGSSSSPPADPGVTAEGRAGDDGPGPSAGIWPAGFPPAAITPDDAAQEPADGTGFWPEMGDEGDDPVADQSEEIDTSSALARAEQLLDELKHVLASVGDHAQLDLSGVISDLEVAVNPPGALAPDDLAEIREALLRAREHPRDLDTVIGLTRRIDGMVALMFAYDRAVAAIERSLVVLRQEPQDATGAESPSPRTQDRGPSGRPVG